MSERRRQVLIISALLAMLSVPLGVALMSWLELQGYRRLIAQGGGEVYYYGALWGLCKPKPSSADFPRAGGTVGWGDRVEIVARKNGYALTGRGQNICWIPEWTLCDRELPHHPTNPPPPHCDVRAPPGWED